ncbi:hypothetical protein ON010_g8704 [Phytophthora cinnamomi]|nr:hypothetical protein ON010_g8704 [Phytophthora cinnamomi]
MRFETHVAATPAPTILPRAETETIRLAGADLATEAAADGVPKRQGQEPPRLPSAHVSSVGSLRTLFSNALRSRM